MSRLINRNVISDAGRTSIRMEPELWDAVMEICNRENLDISVLVRMAEKKTPGGGRTSAVRVFIVSYYREAATELGHALVEHGSLGQKAA